MSLPDLIEIVPPSGPVSATVSIPGSKSITNRALILGALTPTTTRINGALWSEDTQVMTECLAQLGYLVEVSPDSGDSSNRSITIHGKAAVPSGGTRDLPLELYVGNAGTAARFLAALLCLGSGAYRLSGVPRMHERPQCGLFSALRQLGYRIDSANDRLPAIVHGAGPMDGSCRVSIRQSSQFASALILCAKQGGWHIEVEDENSDEAAYVHMTREMTRGFPRSDGLFEVEPDASSASYFIAADRLIGGGSGLISVSSKPATDWQVDARFSRFIPLPPEISRARHLGDSILTSMILAPFEQREVRFTDLGRLRVQECERVRAMRTELSRCGAIVKEHGDSLVILPSDRGLHGAEIETYGDHRIAMVFSILGLKVPGIRIRNPACVKKTFPSFFQKLAAPPASGLGIAIRHPGAAQPLQMNELFAD